MGDKPKPTTGDPKLDAVVESSFIEAIEIARQILGDHLPDSPPELLDRLAALITAQVFAPLSNVILGGIAIYPELEGLAKE